MFGAAAGALGLAWSRLRTPFMRRVRVLRPAWALNNGQQAGSTSFRLRRRLTRHAMLMLSLGSAVLAAQMFDFSVFGSGQGHLVGAALVTVVLGPAAAVLTMAAVITIQSVFLADGGIGVLGANIVNLAVVAPLAAQLIVRLTAGIFGRRKSFWLTAALAGWFSVVAAAAAVATESALFGSATADNSWNLVSTHAVIGLVEAAVTAAGAAWLLRTLGQQFSSVKLYDDETGN